MNGIEFSNAVDAMLECALWSSVDIDNDAPLDQNYGIEDFAPETIESLTEDLRNFIDANEYWLDESNLTPVQIGHDFWLTRNHYGAGFWDRGLGDAGDRLTEATHPFGEVDLYVGDDGAIHA